MPAREHVFINTGSDSQTAPHISWPRSDARYGSKAAPSNGSFWPFSACREGQKPAKSGRSWYAFNPKLVYVIDLSSVGCRQSLHSISGSKAALMLPLLGTVRVTSGVGGHDNVYITHFDTEGHGSRFGRDPHGLRVRVNNYGGATLGSPKKVRREANDIY